MPTYQDKNGKQYQIPDGDVQEALSAGFTPVQPKTITLPEETISSADATDPNKFIDRFNVDLPKSNDQEEKPNLDKNEVGIPLATTPVNQEEIEEKPLPPIGDEDLPFLATVPPTVLKDVSGKMYQIPEDQQEEAIKNGFGKPTPGEYQLYLDQKAGQERVETEGGTGLKPLIGGAADAFLTGALRRVPFNVQTKAGEAVEEKETEQVRQSHPFAYGTGAVAGEIGKAVQLGGAADALTEGLDLAEAPLLSKAGVAKNIAEGAIYSAEPVTHEIINKNPAGAAEALALGVGMNFGLHAVFSAGEGAINGVGKLWNKGLDIAENKLNPTLDKTEAENQVYKALGFTPAQIAKLRDHLGLEFFKAAGITTDDIVNGTALDKIQKLEDSGPEIGKAIDELDSLFKSEKKPIIEEHMQNAKLDVADLMPAEVKKQESLLDRLSAAMKVEKPEQNEAIDKAMDEYKRRIDKWSDMLEEPKKPKHLLEYEKVVEENKNRPTVPPGGLKPKPEGTPTLFGNELHESPTKIPGEIEVSPEEEAKKLLDAGRPDTPSVKAYDKRYKVWKRNIKNEKPVSLQQPKIIKKFIEDLGKHGEASREITSVMDRLNSITLPPDAIQAKKALEPFLRMLDATGKRGDFQATQDLKRFIREQTNFTDNNFQNGLRKQAYHRVVGHIMNAEDAAAKVGGLSPEIREGLAKQRALYTYHKLVGDIADRVEAKGLPDQSWMQKLLGNHQHNRAIPILALHMIGVPSPIAVAAGVALPFAKRYAAKQALRGAAAKLFGEASSAPETNTVLHAIRFQEQHINETVKSVMKGLADSRLADRKDKVKPLDTRNAIKDFLPDGSKGLNDQDRLDMLRRAVTEAGANPEAATSHLGNITAGLQHEGLPQVAAAYTQHQLRLLKVLRTILPADPSFQRAHPFSARVSGEEISQATKDKYQRALSIAANPVQLLEMIKSNNITEQDVAIAAAVNPSTLQKMRQAMVQEAISSKQDLSYQHRLSLGIFMGEHIDQSTQQMPVFQQTYGSAAPKPAKPAKPIKSTKIDARMQDDMQDKYLTASQKTLGMH